MLKIRVLVVDDAVVVRRIVTDVLSENPNIEVVGVAANGRIALAKIPQVNPDLVTLDIEMPEMNGLETLKELRKSYPTLPVIMFSTLTERGASTTLEALSLGASDFVTKPANVGSVSIAMQRIREELIPKINALCPQSHDLTAANKQTEKTPVKSSSSPTRVTSEPLTMAKPSEGRVDVVAIGVSTGGPNALAVLLPFFPKNFPVPLVIVQHMPPFFTKLLAERLASKSQIEVVEGKAGQALTSGKAWLAPGDFHMVVEKNGNKVLVQTTKGPPENSCRPAVDVLFRSVAQVFGPKILAVIMTGMGQDGLVGCQHIKNAGGQIIVQDESSSVVWGMPSFVAKAGLAEKVLPLNQLGNEIMKRLNFGRVMV